MKLLKKLLMVALAIALVAAPAMVSQPSQISAKEATINKTDLDLFVGTEAKLKVSGAKKVKWSSSDASVASVSKKGVVTGVRAGSATITAKAGKTEFTVDVYVYDLTIAVDHATLDLYEGEQHELEVYLTAVGRPVQWTTSDENIAIVDNDGVVTGIAPGTATITATLKEGLESSCTVTVKALKEFDFDRDKFYMDRPGYFGYDGKLDKEASYYLDGVLQTGQLWVNDDGSWSSLDYNELIEEGDHVLTIEKEGYRPYVIEFKYSKPVVEGLIADYYFYHDFDKAYVIGLNYSLEGKTVTVTIDNNIPVETEAFMNGDGYVVAYVDAPNETAGTHHIVVSAEGFESESVDIEVYPNN